MPVKNKLSENINAPAPLGVLQDKRGNEMNQVLRHLRRAALLSAGEAPSDAQLLEAFLSRRDEAAFEALLRRHGPMVLGVCRRVLRNVHDAEDVFQATFLVLSRQAASIRSRQVVASWLYGVAYRTAMKVRAMNAKRRAKERHAAAIAHSDSASGADEALLEQLDHELNRLPEKYRVPVVLCELEGRARKEVAHMLGVPEGTLSWRLAHAKKMLAKRLTRHGATLSLVALATAMTTGLSPALRASTVKAVLTAGAIPAKVLALTEGVMKTMLLSKLKITACAAALMLLAGVGATGLTYRATAEQPALASRPQSDDLEALRLEIEALRKSLQATREQVRSLQEEMRTLKRVDRNPASRMPTGMQPQAEIPSVGVTRGTATSSVAPHTAANVTGASAVATIAASTAETRPATAASTSPFASRSQTQRTAPAINVPAATAGPEIQPGHNSSGNSATSITTTTTATSDPLTHAENALKRLRANPADKRAFESLERALKKLKEQEKLNAIRG
jgi:RNA polymerase sigma factor (sigma-70 family)